MLIGRTREGLIRVGLPYVIENVVGAPLRGAVEICGASLGLGTAGFALARHRLFECSFALMVPPCAHGSREVIGIYGDKAKRSRGVSLTARSLARPLSLELGREAMGIDWMIWRELRQAIPPAYTEHIGGYLMAEINARAAA
jgi:DNA (cytosine-5)-methyltransferase 1